MEEQPLIEINDNELFLVQGLIESWMHHQQPDGTLLTSMDKAMLYAFLSNIELMRAMGCEDEGEGTDHE